MDPKTFTGKYFALCSLLITIIIPSSSYADLRKAIQTIPNYSLMQFKSNDPNIQEQAAGIAADMHIDIQGTIARATVTQYFANITDEWQEGIYTYPLPDNASVDSLTMMIGNKRIIGFVHEKKQAQQIYEKAKAEGKAASLAEQHRPNIFKNSVANIPPQSIIAIELQYQYPVKLDSYHFSSRTPMAITPRFNDIPPEHFLHLAANSDQQWAKSSLEDILTQTELSHFKGAYNPVSISVSLNAGMDILNIHSDSHKINSKYDEKISQYHIDTDNKIVKGTSDFVLSWDANVTDKPIISTYQEELEGNVYSHILILPPQQDVQKDSKHTQPTRQVTYILDTSGSMDGPSIKQAKKALVAALEDLNENDYFNVIEFNSSHTVLYNEPRPANLNNIQQAIRFTSELQATGGTMMLPALKQAYAQPGMNKELLRQIVFITDGAIGYEDEMIKLIKKDGGKNRLFAVGIGSAPNVHLMRSFAQTGRGSFTFISNIAQINETMGRLFNKMKNPALINLSLEFPKNSNVEMIPAVLPDLLAGDPISVAIKTSKPIKKLELTGEHSGTDYEFSHKLRSTQDAKGISKIFAREKIHELELAGNYGQDEAIKQTITALGIKHQIMSRFTSFVAVDEEIIRPAHEKLHTVTYDPSLPHGWQEGRMEGRTASKLYQELLLKQSKEQDQLKKEIHLPQTATGYQLSLLLSLMLMLSACFLIISHKRKDTHG